MSPIWWNKVMVIRVRDRVSNKGYCGRHCAGSVTVLRNLSILSICQMRSCQLLSKKKKRICKLCIRDFKMRSAFCKLRKLTNRAQQQYIMFCHLFTSAYRGSIENLQKSPLLDVANYTRIILPALLTT